MRWGPSQLQSPRPESRAGLISMPLNTAAGSEIASDAFAVAPHEILDNDGVLHVGDNGTNRREQVGLNRAVLNLAHKYLGLRFGVREAVPHEAVELIL